MCSKFSMNEKKGSAEKDMLPKEEVKENQPREDDQLFIEIDEGNINKIVQQTLSEEQQLEVENELIEQGEQNGW